MLLAFFYARTSIRCAAPSNYSHMDNETKNMEKNIFYSHIMSTSMCAYLSIYSLAA